MLTPTPDRTHIIECPVCTSHAGQYCVSVNEYKIYKCPNCGLEHTHPVPSQLQLQAFYAKYQDIRAASDVTTMNARRNLQALEAFGYAQGNTILDFGTGDADFVEVAGENCYGIDFKASSKMRVFGDLSELPIRSFDFITLWGVLEHLDYPLAILASLKPFLKPGGKVVLTTVDAEGPIPYYYKPIEHLTYWTAPAFTELFDRLGMRVVEHRPYQMMQKSAIYADRLLSRTPPQYREAFLTAVEALPTYVEVPTNEVLVVAQI